MRRETRARRNVAAAGDGGALWYYIAMGLRCASILLHSTLPGASDRGTARGGRSRAAHGHTMPSSSATVRVVVLKRLALASRGPASSGLLQAVS
jgi:hypothetical protein